jgi:rod shape-determining protein MreD
MVRILVLGILFPVLLLVQVGLFPYFKINGVVPDLFLIVTIFCGFWFRPRFGAGTGLVYGLLEDLFLGRYLGLNVLAKGACGYLAGLSESRLNRENRLAPVFLVFVGSVVHDGLYLLGGYLAGWPHLFGADLLRIVFTAALYNSVLAFLGYPWFCRAAARGILKIRNPL